MPSVTISSKRQITIPAEVFRLLELKEGQKLMVEVEGDRIVLTARPLSLTKAPWWGYSRFIWQQY